MEWPRFYADSGADRGSEWDPNWINLTPPVGAFGSKRHRRPQDIPHFVSVKVADLPDGQTVVIGLRLDPNPHYDGNRRDLAITPTGLAGFNWREAVQAVRFAETEDGTYDLPVFLSEDDWQKELGDIETLVAKGQDADAKAKLAAFLYREAMRLGEPKPREYIADRIPGRDGNVPCSLDSVNNYLRRARDNGWLPPYEGGQAKHGLPKKKKGTTTK